MFGPVRVERIAYEARKAEGLQPMDAALNLPADLYSHGVRRRVVHEVVRGSFDNAVDAVLRSMGFELPKRQVEGMAIVAADQFEEFYRTRDQVSLVQEALSGPLLILTCDGKGIVMRREDLRDATRKARKPVDKCACYLLKYKAYLRYDAYLAGGLPIATGVIESACRYLVRDRTEITGARWSLDGAEAILRLHA